MTCRGHQLTTRLWNVLFRILHTWKDITEIGWPSGLQRANWSSLVEGRAPLNSSPRPAQLTAWSNFKARPALVPSLTHWAGGTSFQSLVPPREGAAPHLNLLSFLSTLQYQWQSGKRSLSQPSNACFRAISPAGDSAYKPQAPVSFWVGLWSTMLRSSIHWVWNC